MMITIWQVASTPFWALAAYLFVMSAVPLFRPTPEASKKIINRLIAAGLAAYVAARICT